MIEKLEKCKGKLRGNKTKIYKIFCAIREKVQFLFNTVPIHFLNLLCVQTFAKYNRTFEPFALMLDKKRKRKSYNFEVFLLCGVSSQTENVSTLARIKFIGEWFFEYILYCTVAFGAYM
jgi:hypothetical protein